jgi:hypothetical protein
MTLTLKKQPTRTSEERKLPDGEVGVMVSFYKTNKISSCIRQNSSLPNLKDRFIKTSLASDHGTTSTSISLINIQHQP